MNMNFQKRLEIIPLQERAFIEGTIEYIGNEWIFFDETNEEAFELEELGDEVEVYINDQWKKGTLIDNTIIYIKNDIHYLQNGDRIRYNKKLTYSFKTLIEELNDQSYLNFVKTLNELSYSLFDCIYCHNYLVFLQKRDKKEGMNVMIFDNEEQICVVQHYFFRKGHELTDRFEFSKSDGKRLICSFLQSNSDGNTNEC
ncbi:DUF2777 family protein [Calidifontibacillus oryziterrae]|uniref:DUF2777 family protein n=1 Tax=Calidifontibacillus oryziterrae TaxID=1191699 RepID=UPI0002E0CCB0|nr:DUF2777 family protein [Calidifontibacillus oryziterrae]